MAAQQHSGRFLAEIETPDFRERLQWVILLEPPPSQGLAPRLLRSERPSLGEPKYRTLLAGQS